LCWWYTSPAHSASLLASEPPTSARASAKAASRSSRSRSARSRGVSSLRIRS
jgi:hypothetical protein